MPLPNPWAVPVVTIAQAGEFLGMSRTAAYAAARVGRLPTLPVGRTRVVSVFTLYGLIGAPVPPRPIMPVTR